MRLGAIHVEPGASVCPILSRALKSVNSQLCVKLNMTSLCGRSKRKLKHNKQAISTLVDGRRAAVGRNHASLLNPKISLYPRLEYTRQHESCL